MAEVKLLPCPFCGGPTECYEYAHPPESEMHKFTLYLWRVRCKFCFIGAEGFDTKPKAIAAWNTRTPDARLSELKDTLVKTIKMIEAHRDLTLISADHDPECQRAYSLMTDLTRAALSAAALFEQEKSQ